MNHKSLLDSESDTPDDRDSTAERKRVNMDDLITTVAVIKSNYTTKTDIAILYGKLETFQQATKADFAVADGKLETFQQATKADFAVADGKLETFQQATKADFAVANGKLEAFQQATKAEFAVVNGKLEAFQQTAKADLNDAIYQLTWRMAGFAVTIVAAVAALVRHL